MRLRGASGFTLVELLVVIAILAIIAGLLFPVFALARDKARQTMCTSNLKQVGTAFALYATDFDGVLPSPGGILYSRTIRSAWLLSSGPGLGKDIGGLWPYLRQRGNGGQNNVWSCPVALPGPNNAYSPGQNFVMNDYLRACHPGEARWTHADSLCGEAWATGVNPDTTPNPPAQTILLYESAQDPQYHNVNRDGSPFFSDDRLSATPPLCKGMPQHYHSRRSGFLFCDHHVKAMIPGATWTEADQPAFVRFNRSCPGLQAVLATSHYNGSAPASLWDPGGVTYP